MGSIYSVTERDWDIDLHAYRMRCKKCDWETDLSPSVKPHLCVGHGLPYYDPTRWTPDPSQNRFVCKHCGEDKPMHLGMPGYCERCTRPPTGGTVTIRLPGHKVAATWPDGTPIFGHDTAQDVPPAPKEEEKPDWGI